MAAPEKIKNLVQRFHENIVEYKNSKYLEAQVRREFIDPMFKELGWDIENNKGYAEGYKEVVHEDSVRVGGKNKAPDYSFRIGGIRKFFLEAKKPSVNIKDDIHPAFQLRRYAWSGKLPLSILTDFEEFAVYDGRIQPKKSDKSSVARVMYFRYEDYIEKWDEISSIFSQDSILHGSFDKYAESNKKKRGTSEVDDVFLECIEDWRSNLARNIALRNTGLNQRELNYAVQVTIDRIIFLRICEARGIEDEGRLISLCNEKEIYQRLSELFRYADERYNSGLFHFNEEKDRAGSPDIITSKLIIDDKVIKGILTSLYYPDSPYEFSVMPSDILGQVYEQFLGKVIRLTSSHQAKIESKPEVKKAGGVFYTPTYIVEYIINHTLAKMLEGKTPQQVSKVKVIDPACGSGSFLIEAYQTLLDWHLNWYLNNNPEKHTKGKQPSLYMGKLGELRLTTEERKRILLNNIYGVDIDYQAVEVSKLSLLLKVLEGETSETLQKGFVGSGFHVRILPDLRNNIKCGNSLIEPDFYQNVQIDSLSEDDSYQVNVFNWKSEFKDVFNQGGFDIVIGNPPWGANFSEIELQYNRNKYNKIIVRMIDSYMFFMYMALETLVKKSGYLGYIIPDVFLYQKDCENLRRYFICNTSISQIINIGDVFNKVVRPSCVFITRNSFDKKNNVKLIDITGIPKNVKNKHLLVTKQGDIKQNDFLMFPGASFPTSNIKHYKILNKIIDGVGVGILSDYIDSDGIQRGVSPDYKKAFLVTDELIAEYNLEEGWLKPTLTGGIHVKRYMIKYPNMYVFYTTRNTNPKEIPNIVSYINMYKEEITCKEVIQNKHPIHSLHRPRKEQIFRKEKIVGVITEDEIIVSLDKRETYPTDGVYLFGSDKLDLHYILSILNSKLYVFIYQLVAMEKGRVLAQVKPTILSKLPIKGDFLNGDMELVEKISLLSRKIMEMKDKNTKTLTPHQKTIIERQIISVDKQIDTLVYELYGLTDNEIMTVENATQK